ncbi:hypothetical protein EDC01DRAFT_207033 [Geopyxis carbonaria]|nr:hypothetical protein EDC01DRAFT_207033 [Geopyxis carbonaria]
MGKRLVYILPILCLIKGGMVLFSLFHRRSYGSFLFFFDLLLPFCMHLQSYAYEIPSETAKSRYDFSLIRLGIRYANICIYDRPAFSALTCFFCLFTYRWRPESLGRIYLW